MNQMITISGTRQEVDSKRRGLSHDFKRLEEKLYQCCGEDYFVCVLSCTPYSDEELQEIHVYGDPDHEAYLLSDDYESDCQSEQWDWIKNEY